MISAAMAIGADKARRNTSFLPCTEAFAKAFPSSVSSMSPAQATATPRNSAGGAGFLAADGQDRGAARDGETVRAASKGIAPLLSSILTAAVRDDGTGSTHVDTPARDRWRGEAMGASEDIGAAGAVEFGSGPGVESVERAGSGIDHPHHAVL